MVEVGWFMPLWTVALQGTPGWQDRIWTFIVTTAALAAITFVVFYWVPRLRNPRCPECGSLAVETDRNLVRDPYTDDDGVYHKGREEVIYHCSAGHEFSQEKEFSNVDPSWAGQRPEDVFGRETVASWFENEANVGERETILTRIADRLRGNEDEDESSTQGSAGESDESQKKG